MSHEPLDLPIDSVITIGAAVDSTGLVRITGVLEIKPGKTAVKLPPFIGYIFDEDELKAYKIQFPGTSDYTPAFLTTHDHTYVLIDRNANIVVQYTEPTNDNCCANIYFCDIIHPSGFVAAIIPKFDYVVQENNALGDAIRFLDPVIRGCRIVPNGSNLNLDIYSGSILIRNIEDMTKTDVLDVEAKNAFSFVYSKLDGVYSNSTNIIDPENYDNGGVLSTVVPGMFTVQRIGINHNKQFVVQYGNILFGSMSDTLNYITNADVNFDTEPGLSQGATLAYLAIQQGNVALNIKPQAQIYKTNNLGESVEPPNAASSTGSLLVANNLSDLSNVFDARLNLGAGVPNGLATLNSTGKLTNSQIPFTKQYYGSTGPLKVHNTLSSKVLESIVDNVTSADAINVRIQFYVEIVDRNLDYVIFNDTLPGLITNGSMAVSGFQNIVVAKPISNSIISVRFSKNIIGGTDPMVKGLVISYE